MTIKPIKMKRGRGVDVDEDGTPIRKKKVRRSCIDFRLEYPYPDGSVVNHKVVADRMALKENYGSFSNYVNHLIMMSEIYGFNDKGDV